MASATLRVLASTPREVASDAVTAVEPSVVAAAAAASVAEPSTTTVIVTDVLVVIGVETPPGSPTQIRVEFLNGGIDSIPYPSHDLRELSEHGLAIRRSLYCQVTTLRSCDV